MSYGDVKGDELTLLEQLFLQNLAGLSYATGDLIVFDGTKLNRLPKGSADQALVVKADGTTLEFRTISAGGHNLLSATHPDTVADSVVAGDIIIGNATPKWARLAKGADGKILKMVSGLPAWDDAPASMIYPGAGITVSTGSAWATSITDNSGNWNTAYGWGNHADAGYELASNKSTSVSTDGASDTKYPSVKSVKDYADGLVAGLLDYRGAFNASGNAFPTTGGSGSAGAILKGDMYIISVAGTIGGSAVQIGDSLIANVDTPGQTAGNWNILNGNISYAPEDSANKVTSISGASTDVQYPSAKLLYDQLAGKLATNGVAAKATILETTRAIYGNNFDGSAALTQIIASTYGGTGNGFTKFSGAATSEKTYTLPNVNCTILTDNAAVTVGQGGTGLTAIAAGSILAANSANTLTAVTSASGTKVLTNTAGTITWETAPSSNSLVSNETPSGDLNGTDTTYTLANSPITGTLKVYLNGQRLTYTDDYTLATNVITFVVAPVAGDVIRADYEVAAAAAGNADTLDNQHGSYYGIASEDRSGWFAMGACTYEGADAPSYTVSFASDMTGVLSPGMRLKLTDSTVKYFIITAVGAYSGGKTIITVYGGTDYTLSGGAISAPCYSVHKAPQGFPLNPAKWTVEVKDVSNREQASPTASTWYNLNAAHTISVPIGSWRLMYSCTANADIGTAGDIGYTTTLSTANNSESDADFTRNAYSYSVRYVQNQASIEKFLLTAAKTSYYLNISTGNTGVAHLDVQRLIIRAICAYL